MNSGIGHIVCNATCDLCNHYWVAVVEVDFIDYGNKIEYKQPETLQCPNCMGQTSNYEVVIQNKEVQVPMFSSYKIGDNVLVDLYESGSFKGVIVGVKFQLGTVLYDVDVYPFKSEELEKDTSFRFRDISSYFIKDLNNI
jgi:hypothetical protein